MTPKELYAKLVKVLNDKKAEDVAAAKIATRKAEKRTLETTSPEYRWETNSL